MKLTDLDAKLFRYETRRETVKQATMPTATEEQLRAWAAAGHPTQPVERDQLYLVHVDTVAEAHGVHFDCPLCAQRRAAGGDNGVHWVEVTFAGRGVPDHLGTRGEDGRPTRWQASGTGLHDLSLSPSVWLKGAGCGWHGFVGSAGVPPGEAA